MHYLFTFSGRFCIGNKRLAAYQESLEPVTVHELELDQDSDIDTTTMVQQKKKTPITIILKN